MPGLSQYRQYAPPDENGIYHEDPTVTGEWDPNPTPADLADAYQRSQDQLGFANPARSFGDQVFHGMLNNIPPAQWNNYVQFTDNEDNDMRMKIRDIMEMAKRLSPLQEGGPLYERQNP